MHSDALELFCPDCSATEYCGVTAMIARLRTAGILRREAKADPDFIRELFRNAGNKFVCLECHRVGLIVRDAPDEDWPDARPCESCGQPIAAERLEIFPNAKRCATCESKGTSAAADVPEYCPRCGEIMQMRLSSGSGISRYQMRCPRCKT